MSSASHESLSAAYASAYDYLDEPASSNAAAPPPYHFQESRHEPQSTSDSVSSGLPRTAGSTTSSSGSYYSAQPSQQRSHPSSQQYSHKIPQRYASAGAYPDHAHAQPPLRSNTAAPPRNSGTNDPGSSMYAQSNTSMPALQSHNASRNVPLAADDLGEGFANMNLLGTPNFGPQRVRSPGPGQHRARSPAPSSHHPSMASASVRANAAYANQEIYQSAAEVQPHNSLAAIAAQVEQAADGLDPNVPTPSSQGSHSNQMGARHPDWSPQLGPHQVQGLAPHQTSATYSGHYGTGMRQHSAPGDYHANAFGEGAPHQMGWDPNYFPNGQANYAPSTFSGFQPQAGAAGGYPFAQQQSFGNGPEANAYFAAATGYLGFPDGVAPGFPPGAAGADGYNGSGIMPMSGAGLGGPRPSMVARQGTQMSVMSAMSANNGMSSVNSRRKSKDTTPQQTLPFNKSFVTEYRQRMKGDPDPEAQFAYAKYLIEAAKKVQDPGDGPKQQRKYRDTLLSESLKLIKRLATSGMGLGKPPYSEAQFFLANCFGNGSLGLQVDHEKAYNLYVQASKQNHPAATYRTAVCNELGAGTRRDHHRAMLFYRKASALGDTAGMYKLGMVLLNGTLGQPRNVREAVVWLKRAAAQADEDSPHALHELGLLHEKPTNGIVLHDEAYARELFTQAAQLGYSPSQFKLGSAYEYGNLTCPVDPRRSIAWYTKAAGKGDGESELALSGWYLTGSEGVLKQSDSEAYLWARRAASKGIPKAEYAVGYYAEVGIGVESNLDEAKRWYMRAAAQGNKRAMQRLTELKKLKASGLATKKGARPTRKDAESECIVM